MSDISKIKLQNGSVYNLKDAELHHMLNVLLGIENSNTDSEDTQEPVTTEISK